VPIKPYQIETDSAVPSDDRKVIPFRPRTSQRPANGPGLSVRPTGPDDLSAYETSTEPDDFRHRMIMNVAAGLFTVLLTGFGIWLAVSIADLRRTTDCILVGRADCGSVPIHHR
jgi:hypothetical protein